MSFYAYSPLGGGILTGKYAFEQEKEKSITTGRHGTMCISYRNQEFLNFYSKTYWEEKVFRYFENVDTITY
jgi:aryl-alcohol dehydrogenase-like predicted oxidoreductase